MTRYSIKDRGDWVREESFKIFVALEATSMREGAT